MSINLLHPAPLPVSLDAGTDSVPMAVQHARLGFPSPADDCLAEAVNLHELLVRKPHATVLYRAEGDSMIGAGILDGDILVVDRSVRPRHGDLVLATWEGNQPCCKYLRLFVDHIELHSANPEHAPIILDASVEVQAFVIVSLARQIRRHFLQGN